jgi:alkanesulfonate monooxygenase SsuD/methylene tetrahydromethanopterin reductase-like flavin-dependent oxidoreductase (luciferase family)
MSEQHPSNETLPPSQVQRIDQVCDRFEAAWKSAQGFVQRPRIEDFKNVLVEPPPKQAPHPPLWTGAGSLASIKRAAERGHNLILDLFASAEMLSERIALFQAEAAAHGRRYDPLQVVVARDMVRRGQRAREGGRDRAQ